MIRFLARMSRLASINDLRSSRHETRATRFGRREQEASWKNAEVDALYKLAPCRHGAKSHLRSAGCRFPQSNRQTLNVSDHLTWG
jgi:hypothetical protein